LEHVPEGSLKIQNRCKKTYYYHQYKNEENNSYVKSYIGRKNEQLARRLAQKGYYIKVKHDMLTEERKQITVPVRVSVKEKLRMWKNESYEPYQKYQENLKYETDNGEMVRSKSEVIIANALAKYSEHLLYKYERPLEVSISGNSQLIHPDFTIINIHTGKIVYWEHAGRMDDEKYADDFVKKMNIYMENKLFQGDDVIVTYETVNCPLNIRNVKMLVMRMVGE